MLTEIVSPETMPNNNRKMPKGQRFIMGHSVLGIGHWLLILLPDSLTALSPYAPVPNPLAHKRLIS